MSAPFLSWAAPGRVAARFLESDARIRGFMGPIGSGKTGTALQDPIHRTRRQQAHPRDRVRRTKFGVFRSTYRDLERTTIPSWLRWYPRSVFPEWRGGTGGAPAEHVIRGKLGDGTTFEQIMQFIAVGDNSAEDTARGLELTGAILEEGDLLPPDMLFWINQRVGRYPAKDLDVGFDGASWAGISIPFNAPDIEHPLYGMMAERSMDDPTIAFFEQPGGMLEVERGKYLPNPKAENLRNLPDGYYENMIAAGMPYWQIRRMILNRWGASRDGAPVYPEYDDELHCPATEMEPVPGLTLRVGVDSSGLHGAAVISQRTSLGQWRILDELVSPQSGLGATEFARLFVALLQTPRYAAWLKNFGQRADPNRPAIVIVYDPADGKDSDGKTWISLFMAVLNRAAISVRARKAPTNRLTPRIEAVRRPLTQSHGQPDFQINRRCAVTRRGFNSGYRLKRIQVAGADRFMEEPEKNECSHPHDALQYVMLEGGEYAVIMAGGNDAHRALRQSRQVEQAERYDPFNPGSGA